MVQLEPITVAEALERFPARAVQINKIADLMETLLPGSIVFYDAGNKLSVSMTAEVADIVRAALAVH